MKKTLALVSMLAVCSAVPAFAKDDMDMEKNMTVMEKHITDMKTNITGMEKHMTDMKTHMTEMKTRMSDMNKHHMTEADTNKDGMINMSEHSAFAKKMFIKMDANHDEMVSKQEMDNMMMKMKDMNMSDDTMMKSGTTMGKK